jgi:hypothetical protein
MTLSSPFQEWKLFKPSKPICMHTKVNFINILVKKHNLLLFRNSQKPSCWSVAFFQIVLIVLVTYSDFTLLFCINGKCYFLRTNNCTFNDSITKISISDAPNQQLLKYCKIQVVLSRIIIKRILNECKFSNLILYLSHTRYKDCL